MRRWFLGSTTFELKYGTHDDTVTVYKPATHHRPAHVIQRVLNPRLTRHRAIHPMTASASILVSARPCLASAFSCFLTAAASAAAATSSGVLAFAACVTTPRRVGSWQISLATS